MAKLFARIELKGDPDETVYNQLHSHMERLNWKCTGPKGRPLPHGTYYGTVAGDPDLLMFATDIRSEVEKMIWSSCNVLIIRADDRWAMSSSK
jgi:hypothetical protein